MGRGGNSITVSDMYGSKSSNSENCICSHICCKNLLQRDSTRQVFSIEWFRQLLPAVILATNLAQWQQALHLVVPLQNWALDTNCKNLLHLGRGKKGKEERFTTVKTQVNKKLKNYWELLFILTSSYFHIDFCISGSENLQYSWSITC